VLGQINDLLYEQRFKIPLYPPLEKGELFSPLAKGELEGI